VPLPRKMLFHQGTVATPVKTPAEDTRLSLGGLWTPSGVDALQVRSGVVVGTGASGGFSAAQVVAGTGQVTVKPGRVVVQGATANQGAYEGVIDADTVRTLAAATVGAGLPAAGQFKAGRVLVRVYDQLYGDAQDAWDVEVHMGAAAATAGAAVLPTMPASAVQLRTFTVDSAGAITLGGFPTWTSTAGGILPVDALDTGAPARDGQYRHHPTNGLEVGLSGAWEHPFPKGIVGVGTTGGNSSALDVSARTRVTGTLNFAAGLRTGRVYRATWRCGLINAIANAQVEATVSIADSAATPATTDAIIASAVEAPQVTGTAGQRWPLITGWFRVSATKQYSFAPWLRRTAGTGAVQSLVSADTTPLQSIVIEDMGSMAFVTANQSTNLGTIPLITA
jgi:hypothetical protein